MKGSCYHVAFDLKSKLNKERIVHTHKNMSHFSWFQFYFSKNTWLSTQIFIIKTLQRHINRTQFTSLNSKGVEFNSLNVIISILSTIFDFRFIALQTLAYIRVIAQTVNSSGCCLPMQDRADHNSSSAGSFSMWTGT